MNFRRAVAVPPARRPERGGRPKRRGRRRGGDDEHNGRGFSLRRVRRRFLSHRVRIRGSRFEFGVVLPEVCLPEVWRRTSRHSTARPVLVACPRFVGVGFRRRRLGAEPPREPSRRRRRRRRALRRRCRCRFRRFRGWVCFRVARTHSSSRSPCPPRAGFWRRGMCRRLALARLALLRLAAAAVLLLQIPAPPLGDEVFNLPNHAHRFRTHRHGFSARRRIHPRW
mmetsp:Transcript_3652/g.13484  ORF Transcript_3652/g.13484 Transcript_3652/m.13484 type:complete len:225 (-) Transcript_3652:486-1160(-)